MSLITEEKYTFTLTYADGTKVIRKDKCLIGIRHGGTKQAHTGSRAIAFNVTPAPDEKGKEYLHKFFYYALHPCHCDESNITYGEPH